ncbi:Uncharacterised protein [Mycobacteroides abscessus subsp. abscessus]|nr:Uncharacterised protein [Mycobacteroides abscessus subsp. abscessus]SKS35682.1 Uncharacterised protein [Mycobacteroides abscessus subsp. abscessus]
MRAVLLVAGVERDLCDQFLFEFREGDAERLKHPVARRVEIECKVLIIVITECACE